ncbi:MAG: hypothetical protein WCV85_04920 [Patescibacteria group bacterium]|jgi:hypothetical protein
MKTWKEVLTDVYTRVPQNRFVQYFVLSTLIVFGAHQVFFSFAPFIWQFHDLSQVADVTLWMKLWTRSTQHDGYEPFVLYALVWLIVFLCGVLYTRFFSGLGWQRRPWSAWLLLCAAFVALFRINPLVPNVNVDFRYSWQLLFHLSLVAGAAAAAWRYASARWFFWLVVLASAPLFFVATAPISFYDYAYFFHPALKILHSIPWSQIYFQYDILSSFLPAIWLQFHWDINAFAWVVQASYFFFAVGLLIFGKKVFREKSLAYGFFFSYIIIRVYASMVDPVQWLQTTPLRLDLWFVLLIILYFKGLRHWLFGLTVVVLVFLHRHFGLIYAISFFELAFILFALQVVDQGIIRSPKKILFAARTFIRSIWVNVTIIGMGTAISFFALRVPKDGPETNFSRYGIGFMPISRQSFYWFVIICLSLAWIFLLKYRHRFSSRAYTLGVFLLVFSIGNSMYFFGRSHENSIISISTIFLFGLFYFIDLMYQLKAGRAGHSFRKFALAGLATIVCLFFVSYSNRVVSTLGMQVQRLRTGQIHQPSSFADPKTYADTLQTIQAVTQMSTKVYFAVPDIDFYLYYFGGYTPVGYRQPFETWLFQSQTAAFLNDLLTQGYYVIFRDDAPPTPDIKYKNVHTFGEYRIVWNS